MDSMPKILYISQTGMTEPLGQSQVLQYLFELSKKNKITLLSFERKTNTQKYDEVKETLSNVDIEWKHFMYSNRFGLISTIVQFVISIFYTIKKVRSDKIQIIHARSFFPGFIALIAKKVAHVNILFDIRGFAIDEKILSGRLQEKSFLTNVLKSIEKRIYQNSDHIVTLTHASIPIISEKFNIEPGLITVIPTCANPKLFYRLTRENKEDLRKKLGFLNDEFIFLRNGSINESYDIETEFNIFEKLSCLNQKIKFLFINNNQHAEINSLLKKFPNIEMSAKIISADFDKISEYIGICDACIFFIKPDFSKQASMPTKFAELIACHVPSVTNSGYGDMEFYLNKYQEIGLLLDINDIRKDLDKSAQKILKYLDEGMKNTNNLTEKYFNAIFSNYFSVEFAINKYQKIYDTLTG